MFFMSCTHDYQLYSWVTIIKWWWWAWLLAWSAAAWCCSIFIDVHDELFSQWLYHDDSIINIVHSMLFLSLLLDWSSLCVGENSMCPWRICSKHDCVYECSKMKWQNQWTFIDGVHWRWVRDHQRRHWATVSSNTHTMNKHDTPIRHGDNSARRQGQHISSCLNMHTFYT